MEREKAFLARNGWKLSRQGGIVKTFKFKDFDESMRFVNSIALKAEELNHHPDIKISYDKVTVSCITHDESRLTQKDFQLALDILFIYDKMIKN